jgi:hypothetical protein
MIALFIGTVICFGGYRFFLFLLPIWGFFFGLGLGANSVQLILGEAFLGTVTGWVVGFFVGLIFAVLSYLFYAFAVAILAGSLGYSIGVGIMGWIFNNPDTGFIAWLVGVVLAVVLILVTFRFNLAKYVIIVATSLGGAAAVIATLALGVEGLALLDLARNPIQTLLDSSFWWALFFLVLAAFGIVTQIQVNRAYTIEEYNRYASM